MFSAFLACMIATGAPPVCSALVLAFLSNTMCVRPLCPPSLHDHGEVFLSRDDSDTCGNVAAFSVAFPLDISRSGGRLKPWPR